MAVSVAAVHTHSPGTVSGECNQVITREGGEKKRERETA